MRNRRYRKTIQNKLNAIKVNYDGQWFDSKKEAYRWAELKLLERSGKSRTFRGKLNLFLFLHRESLTLSAKEAVSTRASLLKEKLRILQTSSIRKMVKPLWRIPKATRKE